MILSPKKRLEVLDALRRGTVPQDGLDVLAVGLDRFRNPIDEELKRASDGGCGFKAVRGEYGCGKTFFSRWLQQEARSMNFATAEVQISETETPLHKLETVYRRMLERLATSSARSGAFRGIIDSWFFALEEDVLSAGVVDGSDEQALLRDIFADGSTSAERIRSVAGDDLIRSLAEGVSGSLGGKTGIAPRIFLKKLVADLLDRIELHESFDPRADYRLTISATVGNPDELLTWLAGHCEGERRVIQPTAPGATARTDVQLDYVGTLQNAALVISRLYRGEKRLVFCDSRSRVEELGNELRQLGASVFLSHSSLSAEERRSSEKAFSEAQDCVIVSTSTLELGIDVGDLDRVIQIDAPWTVASFLQRLGRTGRRSGALRNCLFLATSENALLRAAALLDLWESGFVEPVAPPARPLHLFAQQLMALSLQEGGIGVRDWRGWIGRLPAFANEEPEVLERIINFLLEHQILYSDGTRLSFGDAGHDLYGRRNFLELVSVFTSDPVFKVLHGRRELGTVDQITFLRHHGDEPVVLSMGGRSWSVTSLDWSRREAFVVPAETKGKSQWQGGKIGLSWRFARAVHALLTNDRVSDRWTGRARNALESLRIQYDFLRPEADVAMSDRELNEVRWFTFSGGMINTALADVISAAGFENVSVTDFWIRAAGTTAARRMVEAAQERQAREIRECFKVAEDYLDNLKFNECLPGDIAQSILRGRLLREEEIDATTAREVVEVVS